MRLTLSALKGWKPAFAILFQPEVKPAFNSFTDGAEMPAVTESFFWNPSAFYQQSCFPKYRRTYILLQNRRLFTVPVKYIPKRIPCTDTFLYFDRCPAVRACKNRDRNHYTNRVSERFVSIPESFPENQPDVSFGYASNSGTYGLISKTGVPSKISTSPM